jgi:alkylation response protein AidB-like acyl-CoA dehydrogenase
MTTQPAEAAALPLTRLSEDEQLLRASVREFADAQIRPHVREMDELARMPRPLIDQLFALGVMGIEIPEAHGGSGGTFFHAVLVVEELSRVDPSVGVLVDVQNTLVVNALIRWGSPDMRSRLLPVLATRSIGAYALSEAASGSDAFATLTGYLITRPSTNTKLTTYLLLGLSDAAPDWALGVTYGWYY